MICPKCGSVDASPIVYGLPTEETFDHERQGAVALGGCVITGNDPEWACKRCGTRFGRPCCFVVDGEEVSRWDLILMLFRGIRDRREALGLSRVEVCERAGLGSHRHTVRRLQAIEKGKDPMDDVLLGRICRALDLNPQDLGVPLEMGDVDVP